jgi:hypothetical protein
MVKLAEGEEDHDDPEPSGSTLSAIDQRIEKVLAEAPQDGLDEDDLKIRKVRPMRSCVHLQPLSPTQDRCIT